MFAVITDLEVTDHYVHRGHCDIIFKAPSMAQCFAWIIQRYTDPQHLAIVPLDEEKQE